MTAPQEYSARLVAAETAAPGLRILRFAPDGALPFQPGQYVYLTAEGQEPRAFSIASAPGEGEVELHVKDSGHGVSHAAGGLEPGARVTLKGPFGTSVLQKGGNPLLAIAGGIGIAPMKSIVAAYLKAGGGAGAHLYWGVREEGQLYLNDYFNALAAQYPKFRYTPVVRGHVGEKVAQNLGDLDAYNIYMAGPMGMIETTTPLLLKKGADKSRIFSDAFSV